MHVSFHTSTLIPAVLLTGLLLSLFSQSAFARRDDDERFDWYQEGAKLLDMAYSDAFIDSLCAVYDVQLNSLPLGAGSNQFSQFCEHLVFEVKWGPVKAGYGVMTARPRRDGLVELTAMAISNNFVSAFYPVRDYVRCLVDKRGLYPVFFEEHINEGRYHESRWELYDHRSGAVYASKEKHETDTMPSLAQTYLSAFYYLRSSQRAKGDTVWMNSVGQGKIKKIAFVCSDHQTIEVDAGSFNAYNMKPYLPGKAMIFGRGDKIDVWMTADQLLMPVYVRAKVTLGSVKAKLLYRNRQPFSAAQPCPVLPAPPAKQ
jgi:hypothetical protein